MILDKLKKHSPKTYCALRSVRDNVNFFFKKRSLIKNLNNSSINIINSLENVKYFEYKKKVFEFDKSKRKRDFAYIEINNSCNINCTMCDTKSSTRQKKLMKLDLIEKSINQLKILGINKVSLHTIGDPLANPQIGKIFQILRKNKFTTSLSSNGLMLNLRLKELMEHIDVCSDLRFSIDGASKETYERIRFGGIWEELIHNLDLAFTKLQPLGYRISIDCVLSKDNVEEAGLFLSFFGKKFKYPHERISLDFINSLAPSNAYFEKNNLLSKHTYLNKYCTLISNPVPYVLVDGSLSVCCRDYDGSLIVGDIKNEKITKIFQGQKFQDLQKAHENSNLNFLSNYNLCSKCYHIDNRISELFKNYVKKLLFLNPRENADFYQKKN